MYGKINASGAGGHRTRWKVSQYMMRGWKAAAPRVRYSWRRCRGAGAPMLSGPRAAVRKERTWKKGEPPLSWGGGGLIPSSHLGKTGQGAAQTHDKVHECRRSPGQCHVVAIAAKEQPCEHTEDHPARPGWGEGWRPPQGSRPETGPTSQGPETNVDTTHHHPGLFTPRLSPKGPRVRMNPEGPGLSPGPGSETSFTAPAPDLSPLCSHGDWLYIPHLKNTTPFPKRLLETVSIIETETEKGRGTPRVTVPGYGCAGQEPRATEPSPRPVSRWAPRCSPDIFVAAVGQQVEGA